MNKKLYFYPSSYTGKGYDNPYCENFKKALDAYFDVYEKSNERPSIWYLFVLLVRAFQADVFVLNWIETSVYGYNRNFPLRLINALLSLLVIKCRNKQIVWIFHNIHPHGGENMWTRLIQWILFRYSDVIISHSEYAKEYVNSRAKGIVKYVCHPVNDLKINDLKIEAVKHDVFMWGTVLSYKGFAEFLENTTIQKSGLNIYILGECVDKEYANRINTSCSGSVVFDNRRASLDEIAFHCKNSKFVVFPYIGNSVSSSGALIDTIMMGGVPVGPRMGAFKDLSNEEVCFVYSDYKELYDILKSDLSVSIEARDRFIKNNSWTNLSKVVYDIVK